MKTQGIKSFILSFVAVAVILGGYVFLWISIEGMAEDAAYLRGDLLQAQNESGTVAGAEKLLTDTKTKRETLLSYFVDKEETIHFIDFVESTAKTARVSVTIENLGEAQNQSSDFSDELTLVVSVSGNFENVFRYLALLENAPYYVEIKTSKLERQPDVGKISGVWTGKITLSVLKRK